DLVGLGVSAISKVGAVYSQNAKTLEEYQAPLDAGHLPVVRGLTASADDLLRRAVIMAIMCQGRVRFADIEAAHGISFAEHFAAELGRLRAMQGDGLVQVLPDTIQVTDMGWFFVRGVAMVFDTYVQSARARFSKIL
ncbi:MAG: coproporphyrinogen III oxidase, partial [Ottowia sp.]|nr:coproporphyrinogen III oxidase [Ottowia sp.]